MDELSLWQFSAAYSGYIESKSDGPDTSLSDTEIDEIYNWMEQV